MDPSVIPSVVVAGLAAGVVVLLAWRFSGTAAYENGAMVLRYGPVYRGIWVVLALAWIPLAVLFVQPSRWASAADRVVGPALVILTTILSVLMVAASQLRRVTATDERITSRSVWGSKSIQWSEIVSVEFSPILSRLTLRDHAGEMVRVDPLLAGATELARDIPRRLRPDTYGTAIADFLRALGKV